MTPHSHWSQNSHPFTNFETLSQSPNSPVSWTCFLTHTMEKKKYYLPYKTGCLKQCLENSKCYQESAVTVEIAQSDPSPTPKSALSS